MPSFAKVSTMIGSIALLAALAGCASDGADSVQPGAESVQDAADSSSDTASGDAASGETDATEIQQLEPSSTLDLGTVGSINPETVQSIAVSPDGTSLAVLEQTQLSEPLKLTVVDLASGTEVASTTFEAIGLNPIHWTAANQIVGADGVDTRWWLFDGDSLESTTQPLEFECSTGAVDRVTGYVFSIGDDGMVCRADPATGSTQRVAAGVADNAESVGVRSSTGEVFVEHFPDLQGDPALVILDQESLDATSTTALELGDDVRAAGDVAWVSTFDGGVVIQPSGAVGPDVGDPLEESSGGTIFMSSNGMDDFVFYEAASGTVLGAIPAGMNPTQFADWSGDDSVFVRLDIDRGVEIYNF